MIFLTAFWIAIYCNHPGRCDVYKATDGIAVKQYPSIQTCKSDSSKTNPAMECLQVNSVNCFNGGSACTYDPADETAWKRLHDMIGVPK